MRLQCMVTVTAESKIKFEMRGDGGFVTSQCLSSLVYHDIDSGIVENVL